MSVPRPIRRVVATLPAATLACALAASGCKPQAQAPPKKRTSTRPEHTAEYVAALAAANEFCHAWRHRDLGVAKSLLSARIRKTFPDSRIHDAISGTSNSHHIAFEISGGSRGADGGFTFRLRLFTRYTGRAEDRIEGPLESMVLRRDQAGKWLVDRFPLLDEPESPEVIVR